MKLHAEHGFRGRVLDLETGRIVRKVIWLDEETGELEAYQVDAFSGKILKDDLTGEFLTYKAKGRFRFDPDLTTPSLSRERGLRANLGAPQCARCPSALTLPGDDLCPMCRATERGQRNRMRVERITNPLEKRPCSQKGCSRLATWSVSDEVTVTPQKGHCPRPKRFKGRWREEDILFERAMVVGRRYYCSFHYQPPRILDAKGEVIQEIEEAHGVRPQ